jgi:ribonuclease P protein component
VDELAADAAAPLGQWLGAVVPKRHARRAVTRSLIKRQIYAAAERHRAELPSGLWVVRLRAPFDRQHFPSAASTALKLGTRSELDALFAALARPRAEALS